MDFGKAFTYVFEDPDWIKKILIAGVLLIIPIVGWLFLGGWMLETVRRVMRGDQSPLADWSDFGGLLMKGLQVFVVGFVFSLPVIVLSACPQALVAVAQESADETTVQALSMVVMCFSCISLAYNIFLALFMPAALGNMAAHDSLGAAFRLGEVFGLLRSAIGAYVIVFLGSIVAGIIASLGLIACFIGVFFTMAYATAVNAHLYGQAYNQATGKGLQTGVR
jgi:hypothetical protein